MDRIILGSRSPRRKQLLQWAGIDFDVLVSDCDESFPPDMPYQEVPVHIARNKRRTISPAAGSKAIVLTADTVVVLDRQIIGKPNNREEAIEILGALSGQQHLVITGVVIGQGEQEVAFSETTAVWFHPLGPEQIAYYVDQYKPFDKAGAYAIQEWIGVVGIRRIEGDFYNVMGLPISMVVQTLETWYNR